MIYYITMPISDKNKRFLITISKEDYARLEQQAKKAVRSVSKQSLYYILEGLKIEEEKHR